MSSKKSIRFCIVASRFNEEITQLLVQGAYAGFRSQGVARSNVDVVWVPGAFELPGKALQLAKTKKYRAIVAVGCILAGETPQYAYLADATFQGLMTAGLLSGIPVTCGVITAQKWKHAVERSRAGGRMNRGREAAEVAWKMTRSPSR